MSVRVAYLGPQGTFTEQALCEFADQHTEPVEPLACATPADAVDAVRAGQADYAVVAIENSVDGAVTNTYDALVDGGPVQIYHELEIEIAFSIMVRPGTAAADIRTIASHPVGHEQVRRWLTRHLPRARFIPASSNAAAAQRVAAGEVDAAAAPHRAAELYGLEELATGVADTADAHTRFVVIGPRGVPTPRTGEDTTLVAFTLPNEPGTLAAALQDFALRGVDLSRIASRPTRQRPGTYLFYADLVGHIDDQHLAEALRALWLRADNLQFLGSWPTAAAYRDGDHRVSDQAEALAAASQWVAAVREGR